MTKGPKPKLYHVGGGKFLTIREIAERTGMTTKGVKFRIDSGVAGAELLTPFHGRGPRKK